MIFIIIAALFPVVHVSTDAREIRAREDRSAALDRLVIIMMVVMEVMMVVVVMMVVYGGFWVYEEEKTIHCTLTMSPHSQHDIGYLIEPCWSNRPPCKNYNQMSNQNTFGDTIHLFII